MLRITLAILTVLALLWARPASAGVIGGLVPGDYCNDRSERVAWSRDQKRRTQERVDVALSDLRVAPIIRAFHRLVICRESFCGEASVRHTRGEDVRGVEDGLGAYGLSLRWHGNKWDGSDLEPALCTPEVSTAIAHEIVWRAVTRYGARNLVEVQAVYGGFVECRSGDCSFTLPAAKRRRFCERLSGYGHSCWAPVTERDLGRRQSTEERRAWALGLARASVRRWVGRHRFDAGLVPL